MFTNEIHQLSYQALLMILILSGPPILISMAVGLLFSLIISAFVARSRETTSTDAQ